MKEMKSSFLPLISWNSNFISIIVADKCDLVDTNEDFSLNLSEIEKAIGEKTKAILINSPNNPTGVVYDQRSLEKLGELLRRKSRESGENILPHYGRGLSTDRLRSDSTSDRLSLLSPYHPGDLPFQRPFSRRREDRLYCGEPSL